jgi:hypothetical protein
VQQLQKAYMQKAYYSHSVLWTNVTIWEHFSFGIKSFSRAIFSFLVIHLSSCFKLDS